MQKKIIIALLGGLFACVTPVLAAPDFDQCYSSKQLAQKNANKLINMKKYSSVNIYTSGKDTCVSAWEKKKK
jgi:hypothetical protein